MLLPCTQLSSLRLRQYAANVLGPMSDAAVAEARRRLAAMRGSLEGLRQHQARQAGKCMRPRRGDASVPVPCGQARLEAVCRQAQESTAAQVAAAPKLRGHCALLEDKEAKLKMQLEELLVEAEKAPGWAAAGDGPWSAMEGSSILRAAKVKPRREDIESLFYSDQGLFSHAHDHALPSYRLGAYVSTMCACRDEHKHEVHLVTCVQLLPDTCMPAGWGTWEQDFRRVWVAMDQHACRASKRANAWKLANAYVARGREASGPRMPKLHPACQHSFGHSRPSRAGLFNVVGSMGMCLV